MNGSKVRKIIMCVLPVAAAIIAAMPGTVQIIKGSDYGVCSYMTAVAMGPDAGLAGLCAPLAALVNYLTMGALVFGLLSKRKGGLKLAAGVSFTSSLLAVLPLFMRNGELTVIPHVMFPIVTLVEAIMIWYHLKSEKTEKDNGKRLELH